MVTEPRYHTDVNYRKEVHMPNSRRSTYVEGNTVRKLYAEPKRREEDLPQRKLRRYPQRKPVKMVGIDMRSFVFLTSALVLIILVAFTYITTQNSVRAMKNEIVELQNQIAETKEANGERYEKIIGQVDLSDVYKKATERLKMSRAENNQIYKYENKKSDMVKQYADIPGADK